ncbi:MAG: RluA family pseudouridine synthase, partial [Candidatus Kerfeldbacteria bacterium]|nr:RluA family pseudouridine synthase [Candidatus Kerfeldbacteria bacterium]
MKLDHKTIFVQENDVGHRLDVMLQHRLGISRNQIQEWIRKERVLVDGTSKRPAYRLKMGELITVDVEESELQQTLSPDPQVAFDVLFEAKDYVVIDKPGGITVHPKRIGSEATLVQGLIDRYPEMQNVVDKDAKQKSEGDPHLRPGIVHRLDRSVSGVMVVARTQKGFEHLKSQWKSRNVTKEYLALVYGHMPEEAGEIHSFIRRSRRHQLKMVSDRTAERGGKEALTTYTVQSTWPAYQLLKIQTHTVRMHQIRLHLSGLGHPIVGDLLYGAKQPSSGLQNRIFLHAHRLCFQDVDSSPREFIAELPSE